MIYISSDGERFAGGTPTQVVEAMAAASFGRNERRDLPTFMGRTAIRVRRLTGISIASDTPERFLNGLVAAGLLKPEPESVA
jgi:hypothetical protein